MSADSPTSDHLRATVRMLREDRAHGASWLAQAAARALGDAAAAISALPDTSAMETAASVWRASARDLAHARPSMAAVATTVARVHAAGWEERVVDAGDAKALAAALTRAHAEALRLLSTWESAGSQITAHARSLLHGTILTHSRSGTVEQVLRTLATAPGSAIERVIVTESRPGGEGAGLARALAARGVPVTLIADAAVGLAASQAQCLVVGADSVRADGSVVNKVGTYQMALIARAAHLPCYVLAESIKVASASWPLVLEEMSAPDLAGEASPGIVVNTTAFDHTTSALVGAIVSERGVLSRQRIRQIALQVEHDLALLDRQ